MKNLIVILSMVLFSTGLAFADPANWDELGTGSTSYLTIQKYYNATVIVLDAPISACSVDGSCTEADPCTATNSCEATAPVVCGVASSGVLTGVYSGYFQGGGMDCNWDAFNAPPATGGGGTNTQNGAIVTINNKQRN